MSPQLENELATLYPDLFADRHKSEQESLISFGCECDDGWFTLLNHVCACISAHIKHGGWKNEEPYRFFQIKEKYAGLRIYDNGRDEFISGVIHMAESLSHVTCEACGKPGHVCCSQSGYWLKTLCSAHMKEFRYRTADGSDDF